MNKKYQEAQSAALKAQLAVVPKSNPPQQPKVDFDAWWAMVENKLPVQHRKEIILADFGARGLTKKETMQSYYNALKKYGVNLK